MKEEKEILEWFSHIFTSQPVNMFTEVFTESIDFVVQRLQQVRWRVLLGGLYSGV